MPDRPRVDAALPSSIAFRRAMSLVTTFLIAVFAVGAAVQSDFFQQFSTDTAISIVPLWVRLLANFGAVIAIAVSITVLPFEHRSIPVVIGLALVVAAVAAAVRLIGQSILHLYGDPSLYWTDAGAAVAVALACQAVGYLVAEVLRRSTGTQLDRAAESERTTVMLRALQAEETRVRREVAEGLHGTVQQRLVLLTVQLDALRDRLLRLHRIDGDDVAEFEQLRAELDQLRERDVRGMSQLLYPAGVDISLAQAARMLARRLPASVAVSVDIGPSVLSADDPAAQTLPVPTRILVVRVLEEAVSNALRHGAATRLGLRMRVHEGELQLAVDDNGSGIPEGATFNGMALLADRVTAGGGAIELGPSPLGGGRLLLRLPLGGATGPAPRTSATR